MTRGRLIVALFVLAGAGLLALLGRSTHAPSEEQPSSGMSAERKATIRDFWTLYREARSLKLAGSWPQAVATYQRALELDPRHEDSLYGLANCYVELNRFEKALECLKRLVEINPMSLRGQLQIGMIHACPTGSQFDLDAAEAALKRAIEINQEETGSLLRLGEVKLYKGEHERAFELFALANRSNLGSVEAYYFRAYIRWKQGRLGDARELLATALQHTAPPKRHVGVPGEGDTRPGVALPPTTLEDKFPLRKFWSSVATRHSAGEVDPSALDAEFRAVDAYLADLRARGLATSR